MQKDVDQEKEELGLLGWAEKTLEENDLRLSIVDGQYKVTDYDGNMIPDGLLTLDELIAWIEDD